MKNFKEAIIKRNEKSFLFKFGHKYIFILLALFILLSFGSYFSYRLSYGDYKSLEESDLLKGRIEDYSVYKGELYIKLQNGDKVVISRSTNELNDPPAISGFIMVGDMIEKKGTSDSIFIYRNKKKYFFLLGKDI